MRQDAAVPAVAGVACPESKKFTAGLKTLSQPSPKGRGLLNSPKGRELLNSPKGRGLPNLFQYRGCRWCRRWCGGFDVAVAGFHRHIRPVDANLNLPTIRIRRAALRIVAKAVLPPQLLSYLRK